MISRSYQKIFILLTLASLSAGGCGKMKLMDDSAQQLKSASSISQAPSSLQTVPGTAVVSGGGVAVGGGIRVEATVGEVVTSPVQSANSAVLRSGLQAVTR